MNTRSLQEQKTVRCLKQIGMPDGKYMGVELVTIPLRGQTEGERVRMQMF